MRVVNKDKLRRAVIGILVGCSGLLLLGLTVMRCDKEPAVADPAKEPVHPEPVPDRAQPGRAATIPPVADRLSQSDDSASATTVTDVDTATAVPVSTSDLWDIAGRDLSSEATRLCVLLDIQETQRAQDRVMAGWPEYAKIREQLLAELAEKYPLADLSTEDLVNHVVASREQFWKEGANLSAAAWKPGYEARLLAEIAAERAPENLTVIDELVETLQSITPMSRRSTTGNNIVVNKELWSAVQELREKQFTQIKAEIAAGRKATFQDFVCGVDLLYLVQDKPPANQHAIEVLQNLQTMCRASGWSKFLTMLQGAEVTIKTRGYGCAFPIYVPRKYTFPEEYRYHRRFPSFRGPKERDVMLLE